MSNHDPEDKRIAVIGVSGILPGGENINSCWETIKEGLDALSELPNDRVDVTAYYDPVKTTKDKIYCKRGGFIPDFDFDARQFGMNMFQVEDADTNQTLTLLKVKEALEDANIDPFSHTKPGGSKAKKNIGVVLGIGGGQKASNEFYSRMNYTVVEKVLTKIGLPEEDVDLAVEKFKANFPEWRLDSFPGFLGNVTAGRCTNVFDLDGMNCVVDAACASSLIALKVAIDELLHGNCRTMICGATCTDCSIGMFMAFSKTPVFSTDQSLTAYDKDTKGMLIGEGSVMLVIKRYADAVADGDDIHCVINGVASSSDGKASGIYSPTVVGQELAISRAYEKAGIDPKEVTLVEGHGTGTPVGDRIELTGLKNIFQKAGANKEQIAVGSIKSQIGHLKSTAGFAGMVKVIMALKHKVLPGSVNVKIPPTLFDNTAIQDAPIYINTKFRPWFVDGNKKRVAGVSSFGFGGANYHAVLSEAESEQTKPYRVHEVPKVFVFGEKNGGSLLALLKSVESKVSSASDVEQYVLYLDIEKSHGVDVSIPESYARVGFVTKDFAELKEKLSAVVKKLAQNTSATSFQLLRERAFYRSSAVASAESKSAALFSGQGSQYVNMFDEVAINWPTFRESVIEIDTAAEEVCGLRASYVLYPRQPYDNETELAAEQTKTINSVQNAQLTTVAVSLGAYNICAKAGLKPKFFAGHSLGELTALRASGLIDSTKAAKLISKRAKLMDGANSNPGKMYAVIGAGASKVVPSNPKVWVANYNSPDQVILTGEPAALSKECAKLKSSFKIVELKVSDAFHSPYMKSANDALSSSISQVTTTSQPGVKFFSNVTGEEVKNVSEIKPLMTKHMTSSVKFVDQVNNMYTQGARIFIEFGPKNTLTKLIESTLKGKPDVACVAVNAQGSKVDAEIQLREAVAQLAVLGLKFTDFDPWTTVNRFKVAAAEGKKKKTSLRLKASTYVSSKTLRERERIMNDGRKVSLLSGSTREVVKVVKEEDATKLRAMEKSLKQKEDELSLVKEKLNELQNKIDTKIETSSRFTSSSSLELTAIKKHREMIVSMLGEYDRLLENLSEDGHSIPEKIRIPEGLRNPTKVKSVPRSLEAPEKVLDQGLLNRAESVVLEVLAEKTGYDVEMLENDMELETELGIDSIKRVEILSEVQNMLEIEAKDVDALSRTRTVGEVIDAMKAEISSGTASTAPPSKAPAAAPPAAVDSALLDQAEQIVLEVLAEKTGYEPDMIEKDMELETELGIDSIKRVEILSEVQNKMNIEAKDVDALSRTRTVGEVIDAMKAEITSSAPSGSAPAPVTTSPVAPSPAVDSALLDQAERIVLEVLAEKTGYEPDMIEKDMELETELGIDSIKRVEILSEVQNKMNIEAKDVDALSRTRTVGEVIDAMKAEISGGSSSVAPAVTSAPVESTATVDSALLDQAEQIVLEVLAEKTGYEPDMIEQDMELETELGIDSIKRVEILSEVQNKMNIEAKDVDALSRTRTVGEVIDAMKAEITGGASVGAAPVSTPKATSPTVDPALLDQAERIVLEVLAEKTGYEPDMIEQDMELETELGIDSIKRVEILSEVQNKMNIEAKDVDALSRTRTVGEVIDAMKAEISGVQGSSAAPTQPEAAEKQTIDFVPAFFDSTDNLIRDAGSKDLNLSYPYLAEINRAPVTDALKNVGKTIIYTNLDAQFASALQKQVPGSSVSKTFTKGVQTVVLLLQYSPTILADVLMFFKELATGVSSGLKKVILVIRGQGTLGYDFKSGGSMDDLQVYGLCGLVKTATHEWPTVQVRAVDISTSLSLSKTIEIVKSELCEEKFTLKEVCYDSESRRFSPSARGLTSYVSEKKKPSPNDVWLVAGGARGITPLCIRELAKELNGGTYYLVGRSQLKEVPSWASSVTGFEAPDVQKAAMKHFKAIGQKVRPMELRKIVNSVAGTLEVIQNLKDIGKYANKVEYISCDITDTSAVAGLFKNFTSNGVKVDSVFHASGVLRDKLIAQKTLEELDAVYTTKVVGFFNIMKHLNAEKLNNLVFFSSLAGFYGNTGQSDYSIANEVLNKLAYFFANKANISQAFDFGPWDGGMVSPLLKKKFIEGGVQIIDRESGATTVARIIMNSGEKNQVLVGNWASIPVKRLSSSNNNQEILFTNRKGLSSHKIKGKPVTPFVSVVDSVVAQVLGVYPGYYLKEVKLAKLFRGLAFDSDKDLDCKLAIKEESDNSGVVTVDAKVQLKVGARYAPAYNVTLLLCPKPPAHLTSSFAPVTSGKSISKDAIYNGVCLFHQPGLQPIEQVMISADGGSMTARIFAEDTENSLKMEEVVLDSVFQACLILARDQRDMAALPLTIENVEFGKFWIDTRSFKNALLTIRRSSVVSTDVWELEFELKEEEVIVKGQAKICLNKDLVYN